MTVENAVPMAGVMPEPRTIEVEGVRTRYYDSGAGEVVVFIYGGNFGAQDSASSAQTWDQTLPALAARFRTIAFDKLGQGFSDNPPRDEDYTMAAVIRHAAAFIGALGLPPVHLVGHSRGGFTAARIALEYPHLVRSLTVINSGTLMPTVSTNEPTLARPPAPPLTRESARWIYEHYSFNPAIVTEQWIETVFAVMSQPKYRESVRKMWQEQLATRLFYPQLALQKRDTLLWIGDGRLQRPTLIVWGYDDRTAPVAGAFELFRMIGAHQRRTELQIINQSGHFPFREHPAQFNAVLARFVASCAAPEVLS